MRRDRRDAPLSARGALTAPGTGFIEHQNGSNVNVIYVRVKDYEGSDRFFSIVINRWHDNVNMSKLYRYGINRSDPHFWETYDWFQQQQREADPLHAGLYDLNRYLPFALER